MPKNVSAFFIGKGVILMKLVIAEKPSVAQSISKVLKDTS